MCVSGGVLEGGRRASQASGGSSQAPSKDHTSESTAAGLSSRRETAGEAIVKSDPGGPSIASEKRGSSLTTGDSITGGGSAAVQRILAFNDHLTSILR